MTEANPNIIPFADNPPKHISEQMIKTNDAYNVASKASTALMEHQSTQKDLLVVAQEASTSLMTEHKALSDMISKWKSGNDQ